MAKEPYVAVTLTDEQKATLEEQHEDILILRGEEMSPWLVVLRRPTRPEAVAYKNHAKRDSATANEQLVRKICVHPTADTQIFEKQLARWPFFVDGIADAKAFREFVGLAVDDSLK